MSVEDLMRRHDSIARFEARQVFIPGGDAEDALQEARIGLWKAVRDFEPLAGVSFRTFARLCVKRQLMTAIKSARRGKHLVLTTATRDVAGDGGDRAALTIDDYASTEPGPERLVEAREDLGAFLARLSDLTPLERLTVDMVAGGCSYAEMAEAAGRDTKAIDNALQRARAKLLSEKEAA